MICSGFLVGTGISVRFLHFSHLRCHLSQFGFQGITTGVDFQLPEKGPTGRKNSPGLTGKGKKKLNKVFRNFNNPLSFF